MCNMPERVKRHYGPTAVAPFGLWNYAVRGLDDTFAPAYAPYGEMSPPARYSHPSIATPGSSLADLAQRVEQNRREEISQQVRPTQDKGFKGEAAKEHSVRGGQARAVESRMQPGESQTDTAGKRTIR